MDGNRETILDELNDFEKRLGDVSPILEDYLMKIAKTGDTMFPWIKLKPLLKRKVELVLDDFYETCPTNSLPHVPNVESFEFEILKNKLLEALDIFHSAPFTIQRICELLTTPRKHYKRTDKFMRGLEKNILVVSTIEPKNRFDNESNNNNAIAIGIMNGLITSSTSDQNGKEASPVVMASAVKIANCDSQFDNFGMLPVSSPNIVTEMSNILQKDKYETPDETKTLTSEQIPISDNSNVVEMDITTYQESTEHSMLEVESSGMCTDDQQNSDNPSPDLPISLNSNNQTLENFSIFPSTSPSSTISDVTNVPVVEKAEVIEPDKNFNCNNDHGTGLNTFQENCNVNSVENVMEVASVVVSNETFVEESTSLVSSTSRTSSSNQDFFQELCCPTSREDSQTTFSHESSENFPSSSNTEIEDTSLTIHSTIEETIISSCDSSKDFVNECKEEKKETEEEETSFSSNNTNASESSQKVFEITSECRKNLEDPPISPVKKDTNLNSNYTETTVLPVQDIIDLESSPVEQTDFVKDGKNLNTTSECIASDDVEMEQD